MFHSHSQISVNFITQQRRTDTDSDCVIYHDNIKILHITTCIQFLKYFLFLISIGGDTAKLGLVTSVFEFEALFQDRC